MIAFCLCEIFRNCKCCYHLSFLSLTGSFLVDTVRKIIDNAVSTNLFTLYYGFVNQCRFRSFDKWMKRFMPTA